MFKSGSDIEKLTQKLKELANGDIVEIYLDIDSGYSKENKFYQYLVIRDIIKL